MNATRPEPLSLDSAIVCLRDARRKLMALYLDVPHWDPSYEVAVAETVVPEHLRDLSEALHAAYEHALNVREELTP